MSEKPFYESEDDLTDAEQERIKPDTDFEADNPDGAADSIRSARQLDFSAAIEDELRERAETIQTTDNDPGTPDRYEDDIYKSEDRALRALKASFARGLGAAESSRGVKSPARWGFARTGDFAKTVKSGDPDDAEFVSDNDLLPSGHPKRSVEDPPDGLGDQPFVEGVPDEDRKDKLDPLIDDLP